MAEPALQTSDGISVVIEGDDANSVRTDPVSGAVEIDQPDGGVVVQLNPPRSEGEDISDEDPARFYRNLTDEVDQSILGNLVEDLIQAVEADDQSRSQTLANYTKGLDLIGTQLRDPQAAVGDSSSGADGMSVVVNPLLLESCLKGWATSVGELLPAEGPAKITDKARSNVGDELADAFESAFNDYLTVRAPEYVPGTSHMLLWGTYFIGSGFKKVYHCPIRRRPVSDPVDIKDIIVSDTTKDLGACERITHQIPMRQGVMKRLQAQGYYSEIALSPPSPTPNAVDMKIAQIQGTDPTPNKSRPEDEPYTLWEIQCELDLPEFAPKGSMFAKKGIPIPYRVTIEKDSRVCLSIRRDWEPDDDACKRKDLYVKFPYVPGPGFYGTGMLGIMGNSSAAMTAAWREALDAGMFASFPGGLVSEMGNRQKSSFFRLAPGEFAPVQTNGAPIGDVVAKLPYSDVTPGLMSMIDKITTQAKSLGTAAEVPIGEGVQNVPVGTMLSYIEQATKVMSAAHKGMHTAQGQELRMIVALFREDPESFWRDCDTDKSPTDYWDEQKLLQALDDCRLVPKSDPNVPSHVHRMMKAAALAQLCESPAFGPKMDIDGVLERILFAMREDPKGIVKPPPPPDAPPPPPDPKLIEANAKMLKAQTEQGKLQEDAKTHDADNALKEQEIKAGIAAKTAELTKAMVVHQDTHTAGRHDAAHEQAHDNSKQALGVAEHIHDATMDHAGHALEQQRLGLQSVAAMNPDSGEEKKP